jgi:hypothetical protein
MRMPASRLFAALALCLSASLAACTDRNPAGYAQPQAPPSAAAMLTCTVQVRAGTLSCGGEDPAVPGVSAAILGGQGLNVRLTSTGMSYDGADTFRVNVTVENLTAQAMGTADGVTPSATGVRVFVHSGPTATGGSGPVAVANADGEALFLAANQKFFQYDGILPPGDTSAAKEWRFSLPKTVTSFTFGVYVAAPVRAEAGWIGMAPLAPAVAVGDTQRVVATVRTLTGGESEGAVAWSTSSASVATVDANGVVTGVAAGTATITATSGARTGSVQVLVHSPTLNPPPVFLDFRVDGASLTSGSPVDSATLRLQYRGTGGFSPYIRVLVRHSTGIQRECVSHTGLRFVGDTREMWCAFRLPDGVLGGAWRVERVEFSGRTLAHAALLAAGAPAYVHVHTAVEDHDAPTLDSMVLHTDTADFNGFQFAMSLWAGDRMFADRAEAFISSAGNPRLFLPGLPGTTANGRTPFQFQGGVPFYYHGGTFVLDSLRLRDFNGNRRTITRTQLAARGLPTQFEVVNSQPDTVPPAFTAFSFSPDSVVGNGTDTVTVTLAAEETIDESGVRFLDMELERMDDTTERRRCQFNAPTRFQFQEMICPLVFSAADVGTWRVRYVRAIDFMNNENVAYTADIQGAGAPTELTVTAP